MILVITKGKQKHGQGNEPLRVNCKQPVNINTFSCT